MAEEDTAAQDAMLLKCFGSSKTHNLTRHVIALAQGDDDTSLRANAFPVKVGWSASYSSGPPHGMGQMMRGYNYGGPGGWDPRSTYGTTIVVAFTDMIDELREDIFKILQESYYKDTVSSWKEIEEVLVIWTDSSSQTILSEKNLSSSLMLMKARGGVDRLWLRPKDQHQAWGGRGPWGM